MFGIRSKPNHELDIQYPNLFQYAKAELHQQ